MADPEREPTPESGTENESESESERQSEPERETEGGNESKPERQSEPSSEPQPEREIEGGNESEPKRQSEPSSEPEPEREIESGNESESERQSELSTEPEGERETEGGNESEAERQSELSTEPEAERETEGGGESEPERQPEPEPQPGTSRQFERKHEPGSETEYESESGLEWRLELETPSELELEPETGSEAESVPLPLLLPLPQPGPSRQSEPTCEPEPEPEPEPERSTSPFTVFHYVVEYFALETFPFITSAPDNYFISTFSIYLMLVLLQDVSDGDTRTELSKIMLMAPPEFYAERYKHMVTNIVGGGRFKLKLHMLFAFGDQYRIKEPFLNTMANTYFSDYLLLPFRNNTFSVDQINHWCRKTTEGKITNIVEATDVPADSRMLLITAVYINADWRDKFLPLKTKLDRFYTFNKMVDLPMMQRVGHYLYGEDKELEASFVLYPFAKEEFSMLFLLPKPGRKGMLDLEKALPTRFKTWLSKMNEDSSIEIKVPTFRTEFKFDFAEHLKVAGMHNVFSSLAEFPGLVDPQSNNIRITKIIHKSSFRINEEGCYSAKHTGTPLPDMALPPAPPTRHFIANRPFMFMMLMKYERKHAPEERHSGYCPLFFGRVCDPQHFSKHE